MKLPAYLLLGGFVFALTSCFSRDEKVVRPVVSTQQSPVPAVIAKPVAATVPKDKSLENLVRYFEQADAIHREAWWVLTEERRPGGKSPFGKVQRALLSSQNIKLANKSLFRCDRYVVKRDVLGLHGYPQKVEVFEKCSEKLAARLLAMISASSAKEVQVTFYPEGLEEVLGLGASVVNKAIQCTLRGNEDRQLVALNCKNWAQDRTKEQMIQLDTYDYEKEGKNLIKLRGKVFENLTDTRKIVADVPLEGKVEVLETELYPPVEEPVKPAPVPKTPVPAIAPAPAAEEAVTNVVTDTPGDSTDESGGEAVEITPLPPLPPPREQGAEQLPQEQIESEGGPHGR